MSALGISFFLFAILLLNPFSTRGFGEVLIFFFIVFILILNSYQSTSKKMVVLISILGMIYLGNNFAGDFYIIRRDFNNTSYSSIEHMIDESVPDRTKALTLMNFWFPLKNNDNYNSYTRWNKKKYKSLDDLLNSRDVEYVIISDYLTTGSTATSGRKENENKINKHRKYYTKVHYFAQENGDLVKTIATNNYGDIEIWKIKTKY